MGTCFRPPKQNDFIDIFESVLFSLRSDSEWYILGDFNICFKQKKSVLYRKYEQLLRIFNLKQIINDPTRITENTASVIDHKLCSHENKIFQSGVVPVGVSDHFLTFCTRRNVKGQISHHNYVAIRSMKNYKVEKFIVSLVQADWSTVFTAVTVNEAWENFKITFLKVLDNIAPVKQIRLKQRTEPWLTAEILELIKIRDMFLYKFRKEKKKQWFL